MTQNTYIDNTLLIFCVLSWTASGISHNCNFSENFTRVEKENVWSNLEFYIFQNTLLFNSYKKWHKLHIYISLISEKFTAVSCPTHVSLLDIWNRQLQLTIRHTAAAATELCRYKSSCVALTSAEFEQISRIIIYQQNELTKKYFVKLQSFQTRSLSFREYSKSEIWPRAPHSMQLLRK